MEASRESVYKQTFAKLGWVLIASQVLMMAVVWAGEELYIRWLIARDPMIGAVELMHKLQDSGVWLIVGALAGLTPCLALKLTEHPKQLPAFFGKKNQRIGGTIMVSWDCKILRLCSPFQWKSPRICWADRFTVHMRVRPLPHRAHPCCCTVC